MLSDIEEQRCTYHPNVRTRLRCSKCGTPICPRCAVETPVGFRCPTCAAVRGLPTYRTGPGTLAKAVGVGLVVAIAVGILWGAIPDWRFYMVLLLGFGVAESMAWAAHEKRGGDLQLAGILLVILGMVVARVVMAERSPFFTFDMLLHDATKPAVSSFFQLRLLPDALFAALALIIPWIRFR
ncbi:MAG TPA: B-box zinc finger protein [Candidatus Limnocylindria bacterium]|nr:B-box zinc finger protein [Candidatus Limnocylindria bacterium]